MPRRVFALVVLLFFGLAWAQPWVLVPATGERVVLTGLRAGDVYQLRASGWMSFGTWWQNGRPLLDDACFEFAAKGFPDPLPVVANDLGLSLCDGGYRDDHVYLSQTFVAPSPQVVLWVIDTDYRDNAGSVLVEALWLRANGGTSGGGTPGSGAATGGLTGDTGPGPYCILRRSDLYGPPNCFEFYLLDTSRTSGALAVPSGGACWATQLALRQRWEIDPVLGGPYWRWEAADGSMSALGRYGGDVYGCLAGDPFGDAGDDDGSGWWDDPVDADNSCPWAFDGECDEPGSGTGACLPGTDAYDCRGVAGGPGGGDPIEEGLPPDAERRDQALNQCDVWSATNSGGEEGTVDTWDVATIPEGAVFDLRFDAKSMPDRFRVVYRGVNVFESGWRGSSTYDGNPAYPGGVVSPGSGEAPDLFAKSGSNAFTVVVIGGESGTVWDYSVRCRTR
ncbi:MAG: hypothetical protein K0A98_06975 [Trueperaceae bacterium]|nr:hypothetical protein [Trueperaceae bacterium]